MKITLLLKSIFFCLICLCLAGWGPLNFLNFSSEKISSKTWIESQAKIIYALATNIDPAVLKIALAAYTHAKHAGIASRELLTIIDYSKPSTERRLWVLDMKNHRVLFNTWVSHGRNSGNIMATSFSNKPGSLKSSLGVFLTKKPYIGNNGYSLRLTGLELGINDNALQRDIVVHGAWYVHPNIIEKYGQLGRSWGCPAVGEQMARPLIDTIKDDTLVLMYYPDRQWLHKSSFLV